MDYQETGVNLVHQELQGKQVILVDRDLQDSQVQLELLANQEHLELKEHLVLRVNQDQ